MPLVAIAGLGVIGGSLAKALSKAGNTVRGYSPLRAERERARAERIGVVDALDAELVRDASAVVIAVPLDRIASVARDLRPHVPDKVVMIHTGSLQRPEALGTGASDQPWLVGTHPLAGSEGSGFEHARVDLFSGAAVSIEDRASPRQRGIIEKLWRAAGATTLTFRSAETHDDLMSWVSHLPQLGATALALALSRANVAADVGGSGLRDMTRIAASSLMVWRPILDAAPAETIRALRALEQATGELRSALESGDQELLSEMWTSARGWRTAVENQNAG